MFTLETAERLIPELQKAADAAAEIQAKARARAAAVARRERQGGDAAGLAIERGQLRFLEKSLEDLLRGIEQKGCVLKGLDPFLVDFPFLLDGVEVYLCWKAGEKAIRHYHPIDEGFSGRKELPKNLLPH